MSHRSVLNEDLIAVEVLFSIAEKIETPLSLAALVLLILFAIYKLIFERLRLEKVVGKDVYRLASLGVTFLFILGIISLTLGIMSYLLIRYINSTRAADIPVHLRDLGSDAESTRLASIHSLVTLAGISKPDDISICEGISSLVRQRAETGKKPVSWRPEADIQTALEALSELVNGGHCASVDLSNTDLHGLQLPQGKLMRAKLTNTILNEANLVGADLTEAHLIGARLVETILRNATLKFVTLNDALMTQTDLRGANLTGAKGLANANLLTAMMSEAILNDVDLRKSKLPTQASLRGISLKGADLRQTDLRSLKVICKNSIESAVTDATTKFPEKFEC